MRRIIADVYKIIFRLTQNKAISLFSALIYFNLVALMMIYGIGVLGDGLIPGASYVRIIYTFPYVVALIAGIFILSFVIMLPLQNLSRDKETGIMYIPLIVITLAALILFVYIKWFFFYTTEY